MIDRRVLPIILTTLLVVLAWADGARAGGAYAGPVKEIPSSVFGWEVNKTTKGGVCLFGIEECQPGKRSEETGGFRYSSGVAVNNDQADPAHFGHVYVIDFTFRVQELAADGSFVRMFGWDVNKTKVQKGGATQQEMNVCTAVEVKAGAECQRGVEGSAPGQFGESQTGIAIDPTSGTVYVSDGVTGEAGGAPTRGVRVQEFTPEGVWVGEIGKEVNETKDATPGATAEEKDLCTRQEVSTKSIKCTGPAQYHFGGEPPANATEAGVFPIGGVATVAVGGPEDLLYVGAGARVQEFAAASASFKRQVSLEGQVKLMAVDDSCRMHEPPLTEATTPTCASFDPSFGDLYVLYQGGSLVHKLTSTGAPLAEFPLSARNLENSGSFSVSALAVDPAGRWAVSESEGVAHTPFGSLLDATTGRLITEFSISGGQPQGLAFGANGGLYASAFFEVLSYTSVHVAELLTRPASCVPGSGSESNVTFDCALGGEANPEEVANTEAWVQWGLTPALGQQTPVQALCTASCGATPVPVPPAVVKGVRPNATVYYRLAGRDQNVVAPELLTSATASHSVPVVPPRIVGAPSAPFVSSSSAVLQSELNPENAPTKYFFEYASELGGYCEGTLRSATLQSSVYGKIGATSEVTGLAPASTYQYRLCATDEAGNATGEHGASTIPQGTFTTASGPAPRATTAGYSALGMTSATIAGSVDPDGQPATYAFELGAYEGAATQYVVVFSGAAGAGTVPVEERLALTDLQPGTTYAYRIAISSGYIPSESHTLHGETSTFTTTGLPSLLAVPSSLSMLATPPYTFPLEEPKQGTTTVVKCKRGYTRGKHGRCVKTKRKKKGRKARRATRPSSAHHKRNP
jgi:hypothetical protein